MIEQAMYFALGFLVAGLFILMFLPALWRRAMRLSMRRLQMSAPMSMEEVVAERDLLRADFAQRQRRMEQEMASVRASKTLDMVEIGRQAARVRSLDDALIAARGRIAELEDELRGAQKVIEERTDLLSSTESALHEMTERAERGVASLRHLQFDHEELARETEAERSRSAGHAARVGDLHQKNTDLARALEKLQQEHAALGEEAQRLAGVDEKLAATSATLTTTTAARDELTEALAATREKLAALEKRRAEEVAQLEDIARVARGEARESADRLEAARADNAMLLGTVEALRRDHAELREARKSVAGNGEAAADDADVAALRAAIVDIGAKMARLEEARDGAAPERRAG